MLKKQIYFSLLLLTLHFFGYASEPYTRKISTQEGLPTQVIYDMFIDSKGYIYLGTDRGLIRYNGHEYKRLPMAGQLANSINNISEDVYGRIWCKNFGNQVFCMSNDTLKTVAPIQAAIKRGGNLREITLNGNELWIACQKKVFLINLTTKTIKNIHNISAEKEDNQYCDIKYDTASKTTYFTDLWTIYSYKNGVTKEIKKLRGQKNICIHNQDVYVNIKNADRDIINVSTGEKVQSRGTSQNINYNYLTSTTDKLWICSNDGLYTVDTKTHTIEDKLLSEHRISDIIKDYEGNLWISSLDDGLYFLPSLDIHHIKPSSIFGTDNQKYTRLASGPNHTLFIGNNRGEVFHMQNEGKLINNYKSPQKNEVEFFYYDSLTHKLYYSFGLINLQKQSFENYVIYDKGLYPDDKGNFIVCTYNLSGIIAQKPNGKPNISLKRTHPLQLFGGQYEIAILNKVRSRVGYFSIAQQRYYIGSSEGLLTFDSGGDAKFIKLSNGEHIVANQISEAPNGDIWISTIQNGLLCLNHQGVVDHITVRDGLSSNNCKKFALHNQEIWLITDEGLNSIDLQNKKIKNISEALSLQGISLNDIIFHDNYFWLATGEGILKCKSNINTSYSEPLIYFKRMLVKGENKNIGASLPSQSNDLEFDFDAIHYKSHGYYSYRYRLLGYDSIWQNENINKKNVTYLSLPHGDYIFQVQAYAADEYSELIEVPFSIQKPFWLNLWFILLIVAISIYLLVAVYRFAAKRTKKQQLIKEQIAMSQLTALRAQMNPHFLFNVLNTVQGLMYADKRADAGSYLGKFSDLMRKTLEISDKQEIWLHEEIEILHTYIELEAKRFNGDFEYHIEIVTASKTDNIKIPSMIIQPYVENAIKHGLLHKKGTKQLLISIKNTGDNLEVIIDDNGIGRRASYEIQAKKKHQSFATKAIASRVELLNKILNKPIHTVIIDKTFEEYHSMGTIIKIIIPI